MSDYCPWCNHETALILTANQDGYLMTCTECGRHWDVDHAGTVLQ